MDERIFRLNLGKPIPAWDLNHRLPIHSPVGPDCRDSGTLFRLNSHFMDVTDQPYITHQWLAIGVMLLLGGATAFLSFLLHMLLHPPTTQDTRGLLFLAISGGGFLITAVYFGRHAFFSLSCRPIRFHRSQRRIFAIRRRRFADAQRAGDITVEIPWSEDSIFCVHRGSGALQRFYHIRYYKVDANNKVIDGFAMGKLWVDDLEGLLAQWNYWCMYMNEGPERLPKPLLFFKEREDLRESFLFCLYADLPNASVFERVFYMPMTLLLTAIRHIAIRTCREPIWPPHVSAISHVAAADAFNEPCGNTPVGWAQTALAREEQKYPRFPRCDAKGWRGSKDASRNAEHWRADRPSWSTRA